MHLILLLAVAGASAWGSSAALGAAAMQQPDLTPRVAGFNANWLMGGLGVAGLILGGPILAAAGAGAIAGALINKMSMARTDAGLQNVLALQQQLQLTDKNAPAVDQGPPTPPLRDKLAKGAASWFRHGKYAGFNLGN